MKRRDLLHAFALTLLLGCSKDSATPPDRGKILSDLVVDVIEPSYVDAATDAAALATTTTSLRDAPSDATLQAARAAWRKARASWKFSDAFLVGPAGDLALTGGVIDTASDFAKIEAVALGTEPIEIGKLGASQRGFGGIEALLFDPAKDDAAIVASLAGRRGQYVALLGEDLRVKVEAVRDAWKNGYSKELSTSGRGSAVYKSERQGVDAIVNGLINASEVLIALRLAKPLGLDKSPAAPAPDLIESPRSDASIDDIVVVLDGIEAVYFGKRGALTGLPLRDAIAERNPGAATRFDKNLIAAKEAVRAVPGPLRTAVVERRDPVIAAHAAVREVKRTLATEVAAALGTSVGFNVTDGD